jgi:lambda family phage minor tail protein L
MNIVEVSQSSNPGELVALYRLDATSLGDTYRYFCQGKIGSASAVFGGQEYMPIDISFTDFEVNAGGVLPTPKMQIGNTSDIIQGMVNAWGDLIGCEIRRVRTWRCFLDDGADPDPTAFIGPDIFRLERKSDENSVFIEWELSASIDQEGRMLPGRQVIRDQCPKRYRIYDPTSNQAAADGFVYSAINPCPYAGTEFFDINGAPCEKPFDQCGRKVADCELRFFNEPLPFGGFPGVARFR